MKRLLVATVCLLAGNAYAAEPMFGFTQGERVEYVEAEEHLLWDLQGRYGGDYHRFWWKTEGALDDGSTEDAELQLLYSRAWTAYFDLQVGVRYEDFESGDRVSLVAGTQGMAPYKFEVDAAAFLSEDGDLSVRAEFERDLFLSNQLILQPRAELQVAFSDVPEIGVGSGLSELSLGLRLRYEYSRRFAPYVGVEWEGAFGDTADLLEAAGEDTDVLSAVLGVRFMF